MWRQVGIVFLFFALASTGVAQRYSVVPLSEDSRDKGFVFWDMSLVLAQGIGDLSGGNIALARREAIARAQANVFATIARLLGISPTTTGSLVGGQVVFEREGVGGYLVYVAVRVDDIDVTPEINADLMQFFERGKVP